MSTVTVCDQCGTQKPTPITVTERDGTKGDICGAACLKDWVKAHAAPKDTEARA